MILILMFLLQIITVLLYVTLSGFVGYILIKRFHITFGSTLLDFISGFFISEFISSLIFIILSYFIDISFWISYSILLVPLFLINDAKDLSKITFRNLKKDLTIDVLPILILISTYYIFETSSQILAIFSSKLTFTVKNNE